MRPNTQEAYGVAINILAPHSAGEAFPLYGQHPDQQPQASIFPTLRSAEGSISFLVIKAKAAG